MENAYTKIFLREIEADVRIGILERERGRTQKILVNVELFAARPAYLAGATGETIIDYSPLYELVRSWEARPHTDLIETFVRELQAACFAFEDVSACRVSVTKPEIFEHARGAGVEAFATRIDFQKLRGAS